MKRRSVLALLLALVALFSLALGSREALAHGGGPGVTVQPLTPKPGDVMTVHGEDLGAKATVEVRIQGTGVDIDLGETDADATGDFTAQFRVPATLKPGTYQLKATGTQSATVQIDVVAATTETAPTQPVMLQERERPLVETLGLIILFGLLSGLGLFFARTVRLKPQG